MGKTIIRAENLSFKYKDSEEGLFGLNFAVEEGDFVLLAGDSGCGKSSLIKCLNGLIPHLFEGKMEGSLSIDGGLLSEKPMSELSKIVGSVFQNPRSQFFTTNSTAELVFAMENYGYSKEDMDKRLGELCEEFQLEGLLNRDILSLSSGERQMLALACSLSLKPRVMLFDEPSANLDYGNTMLLAKILKKLKQDGITIFVADHRFHYLKGLVDRVFLFDKGHMRSYDSEEEFRASSYDTRSFELFELSLGFKGREASSQPLVSIVNLSYKHILRELSLSLYKGEITVLIGNNGAGKTTLAKLLAGSYKPSSGKWSGGGLPLYIMQDADFQLFGASVYQELKIAPGPVSDSSIHEALAKLDLSPYRDKHPFDLSGGQKQRLQIGMALVSGREFFIFDEPTSGLDVKSMNRVAGELELLKENSAVIVISHDYEFIRRVADRIVYLKNGSIAAQFILNEENLGELNTIFREMEENAI